MFCLECVYKRIYQERRDQSPVSVDHLIPRIETAKRVRAEPAASKMADFESNDKPDIARQELKTSANTRNLKRPAEDAMEVMVVVAPEAAPSAGRLFDTPPKKQKKTLTPSAKKRKTQDDDDDDVVEIISVITKHAKIEATTAPQVVVQELTQLKETRQQLEQRREDAINYMWAKDIDNTQAVEDFVLAPLKMNDGDDTAITLQDLLLQPLDMDIAMNEVQSFPTAPAAEKESDLQHVLLEPLDLNYISAVLYGDNDLRF